MILYKNKILKKLHDKVLNWYLKERKDDRINNLSEYVKEIKLKCTC